MTTEDPAPSNQTSGDVSRSQLAAERTLLAWWRSGLAALAVALGVGRLVPALVHGSAVPFVALGVGFGVLSLIFIIYGARRQQHVERAIAGGDFRTVDGWVVVLLSVMMSILAIVAIAVVLASR